MKTALYLTALAFLLGSASRAEDYRTFANPDKSKVITAAVVNLTEKDGRKMVVLQTPEKRQFSAPVESFCKEDQEYIRTMGQFVQLRRSILCQITENRADPQKADAGGGSDVRKVTTTDVGFKINFRNQSALDLEGLQVKYQIIWKKAERQPDKTAKRVDKITAGEYKLDKIAPRGESAKDTLTVPIVMDKANRSKSACSS